MVQDYDAFVLRAADRLEAPIPFPRPDPDVTPEQLHVAAEQYRRTGWRDYFVLKRACLILDEAFVVPEPGTRNNTES
jgi:hypothetical protein